MSEKSAKELLVKSIRSAVQRDTASGDGVDILIITKHGSKEESITF
jgi:proteasome beta subunit